MLQRGQSSFVTKDFADRIDLMSTINRLVTSNMEIDPRTRVLAMALDVLSSRHLLYRIGRFYASKDIGMLLQSGWNKRPMERPTTSMMTTKFESVQVIMIRGRR